MTVTPTTSAEPTAATPTAATAKTRPPRESAPKVAVEPLGPDSLTWKYFGDIRSGLMGMWIGAIENMYPALGAGVQEHSTLWREPLQRVSRSVYPIMGVVYDGARAQQTAQEMRDWHKEIKGVDEQGRRYHSLDPETFYWAHATFFMMVVKLADLFCGGLTEAEKHQLFDEHVQWYRMYGMSMRPVPKTWEEFCEYWDRIGREELELTPAARKILHMRIPKPSFVLMPTAVWNQLFEPMLGVQRWVAAGLFEPAVREKAGLRWSEGDEVLFRLFGKVSQLAFTFVPEEIRLHPRALGADRRERGEISADTPLEEAPWFMAPPKDRRDDGMHYVPRRPARRRNLVERAGATLIETAGSLVHSTFSLAGGRRPSRPKAA